MYIYSWYTEFSFPIWTVESTMCMYTCTHMCILHDTCNCHCMCANFCIQQISLVILLVCSCIFFPYDSIYFIQQAHYHSVTGELITAQQEISQYLANTEQLNTQITYLQSQVATVVSEREGALEQATQLSASLQKLEKKVQELEAQKDQLEEDRFTAQTALQELKSQYDQVSESIIRNTVPP